MQSKYGLYNNKNMEYGHFGRIHRPQSDIWRANMRKAVVYALQLIEYHILRCVIDRMCLYPSEYDILSISGFEIHSEWNKPAREQSYGFMTVSRCIVSRGFVWWIIQK